MLQSCIVTRFWAVFSARVTHANLQRCNYVTIQPSLLLGSWANHRTAIHLGGWIQPDFTSQVGRGDFVVRGKLARGVAIDKSDLHFQPQRVKTVSLNSVQNADER